MSKDKQPLKIQPNLWRRRSIFSSILALCLLIFSFDLAASSTTFNDQIPKELLKQIEQSKLFDHKSWAALLGAKKTNNIGKKSYRPTEDGGEFHTVSDFNHNWLEAEMLNTIKLLLNPQSKKNTLCKYPARSLWISSQLKEVADIVDFSHCLKLNEWTDQFLKYNFSLAFASSDFSKPASMFGHTFLALHTNQNNYLEGYSINYAANFSDKQGGLSFFYKGLVGGYPGIIAITPLHSKIKEYTIKDQRDLFFFKLSLKESDKRQIIFSLWERKEAKFDYFFTTENCSLALLQILQTVDPIIDLPYGMFGEILPFETVKSIAKTNRIEAATIISASQKKLSSKFNSASNNEKKLLLQLIKKEISFKYWQNNSIHITELTALKYLNSRIQEDSINRVYGRELRRIILNSALSRDTRHSKHSNELSLPYLDYNKLFRSHSPTKISLKRYHSNINGKYTDVNLRWVYHDLLDPTSDLLRNASVEAFSGTLRFKNGRSHVERLDLISVKSLPNYSILFPERSKNLKISLDRSEHTNDKLGLNIVLGRGLSRHYKKGSIIYGFINANVAMSTELDDFNTIGASSELGINTSISDHTRVLISFTKKWFPDESYSSETAYFGLNYFINHNNNIAIELENKKTPQKSDLTTGIKFSYLF